MSEGSLNFSLPNNNNNNNNYYYSTFGPGPPQYVRFLICPRQKNNCPPLVYGVSQQNMTVILKSLISVTLFCYVCEHEVLRVTTLSFTWYCPKCKSNGL